MLPLRELIYVVGMIAALCGLFSQATADALHYIGQGEPIDVAIRHALNNPT